MLTPDEFYKLNPDTWRDHYHMYFRCDNPDNWGTLNGYLPVYIVKHGEISPPKTRKGQSRKTLPAMYAIKLTDGDDCCIARYFENEQELNKALIELKALEPSNLRDLCLFGYTYD